MTNVLKNGKYILTLVIISSSGRISLDQCTELFQWPSLYTLRLNVHNGHTWNISINSKSHKHTEYRSIMDTCGVSV